MKRFNVKSVASKAINTSLFTLAIVLFLSGFAFTPAALAAELVVNGSFEQPVVTSSKNWTTCFGENYTFGIEISGPRNRIPSRLKSEIWSMDDPPELVQTVQFHTSCSQPLFIGDEFHESSRT